MQFLPSTFDAYGNGGDIRSPRDSIMAAGRYLAANGFADDPDRAIFRYNNADRYVRAVNDYAAVLAAEPRAFAGYYRWEVYYRTTAGDILLPVGYVATSPIPVQESRRPSAVASRLESRRTAVTDLDTGVIFGTDWRFTYPSITALGRRFPCFSEALSLFAVTWPPPPAYLEE
jgi:hypothetical protein